MSEEDEQNTLKRWGTIYEAAIKIAFPILLGMGGWTFNTLWDHQNRLVQIESSRYTRDDARLDLVGLQELSTELRVQTGLIQGALKQHTDRMGRLEQSMGNVAQSLDAIERKLRER